MRLLVTNEQAWCLPSVFVEDDLLTLSTNPRRSKGFVVLCITRYQLVLIKKLICFTITSVPTLREEENGTSWSKKQIENANKV